MGPKQGPIWPAFVGAARPDVDGLPVLVAQPFRIL